MGISERKEREREEMRDLILNAARRLFLSKGFEKTSIRNIADAIEYSPATIYLYYRDKNELLLALHNDGFDKMRAEFATAAEIIDPFEQLTVLGGKYIDWGVKNPELYDLCFIMEAPMESLACKDEVWEDGMTTFNFLKQVIQRNVEAGYFRADEDLDNLALTIWSYVHGLVSIYLKKRMGFFEDDRQYERMIASFALYIGLIREGLHPSASRDLAE